MARHPVFPENTRLWHPEAGWQTFPQGGQDPGPAWFEAEVGHLAAKVDDPDIVKALKAEKDRNEVLQEQLRNAAASLSQVSGDKEKAGAELSAARDAGKAAERAKEVAEATASELTTERDRLAALVTKLQAQIAAFDPDKNGAPGGSTASSEKDEIVAALTELGVEFDGRLGVAKLRELLVSATAPAKEA